MAIPTKTADLYEWARPFHIFWQLSPREARNHHNRHLQWREDGTIWKQNAKGHKRAGWWRLSTSAWRMSSEEAPEFPLKPSRLEDPAHIWRLIRRVHEHRLATCGAKLGRLKCQIAELFPEGARLYAPCSDEKGYVFDRVTYRPDNRPDNEFTPWSVDQLSSADHLKLTDLERLSLVSPHVDLVAVFVRVYSRNQEWWTKYHRLSNLLQTVIGRLLPRRQMTAPYHRHMEPRLAIVKIDDATLYFGGDQDHRLLGPRDWSLVYTDDPKQTDFGGITRLAFGNQPQEDSDE